MSSVMPYKLLGDFLLKSQEFIKRDKKTSDIFIQNRQVSKKIVLTVNRSYFDSLKL